MPGCFFQTDAAPARRSGVDRGPGHAVGLDDVALAVQRVDQPLGGELARRELVDVHVVGARLGDRAVVGDDDHAAVAGLLDHRIKRGGGDGEGDDRVVARGDHLLHLLDLAVDVGAARAGRARDVGVQLHLVVVGRRRRLGCHQVLGLDLPVVADVAHRQGDLEHPVRVAVMDALLGRRGGAAGRCQAQQNDDEPSYGSLSHTSSVSHVSTFYTRMHGYAYRRDGRVRGRDSPSRH